MLRSLALIACLSLLGACAPPEQAPKSPSGPRGWVELTLSDSGVPADPVSDTGGAPLCHIEVTLEGLTVLSEPVTPSGSSPPYTVESTFRFAARPGPHTAVVYYAGCRTWKDQLDSREARIPVSVQLGHVTRLHFDGSTLRAHSPTAVGFPQ